MRKFISDEIATYISKLGVDCIYIYPGGNIAPLVNSFDAIGITIEVFKHEQGAVYAAMARARLTGNLQVAMVSSGPGVTNAITPLADAFYDSTPLLLITGQIGTADLFSGRKVRQRGFQETPTLSIVSEISKLALLPKHVEDVLPMLNTLVLCALEGRRGPVVFDLPMDIQRSPTSSTIGQSLTTPRINPKPLLNLIDVNNAAKAFLQAKRPVVMLGHGALTDGLFSSYSILCNKFESLCVCSLLGLGSFDGRDQRFLGYIGHTGHEVANVAVHEADFVLVLGARLDLRQTGSVVNKFVPNGKIAWVNNDETELLAPRVRVDWSILSDVRTFLDAFITYIDSKTFTRDKAWISHKVEWRQKKSEDNYHTDNSQNIFPKEILELLDGHMQQGKGVVVTGVGSHQQWAARHLTYSPTGWKFITSGGHGAMGYDLPTSIGAAMFLPKDHIVLCVVGDGSFLMNIQELASLAERKLNVKILLMNNHRLGIVSQFQLITWGNDAGTGQFVSPDFVTIAQGFGLSAKRVVSRNEMCDAVTWLWSSDGPTLLEVQIDHDADVVPMLLGGQIMSEMWQGSQNEH